MFSLTLTDVGPNRLATIRAVAKALGLSNAESRELVDSENRRVAVGDDLEIAVLRRKLQEAGVRVTVAYCPEAMEPECWVREDMSLDKVTCRECGSKLFFAVPGLTTAEKIVEFAKNSNLDGMDEIVRDRWIHPGVYCPNGCRFVMVNLGHPDKYTGTVQ